jgi:hypothetical protein
MYRRITSSVFGVMMLLVLSCATANSPDTGLPQSDKPNYPPEIEKSPARQEYGENAWRGFLNEYKIDMVTPDLHPILGIPGSLPSQVAQRVRLTFKDGTPTDASVKEGLRAFIDKNLSLLVGMEGARVLNLKDLSLARLSNEGSIYRATYRQMSYPYPIVNGFGQLDLTIGKDGSLLQLSSRLLPAFDFISKPQADMAKIADEMIGREFKYSGIDGRPLSSRVERRDQITVGTPVIYPREEADRIILHLAYPVEVGSGLKWTVFIDAVTGREIAVRQNFNT